MATTDPKPSTTPAAAGTAGAAAERIRLGKALRPEEKIYTASQWQLMRWRFAKHKLAVASVVILALFYLVAIFCEFIAPHDPVRMLGKYSLIAPRKLHFRSDDGFHLRPFVYGVKTGRDPKTLGLTYEEDQSTRYPIHFFVRGDKYRFWGIWRTDLHLFGLEDESQVLYLLGGDMLGQDTLSRMIYGARISLSVGFVGVMISLAMGIAIGGISGYFGGPLDMVIQRIIELLRALPRIPLWLALAAAFPQEWNNLQVYFATTLILSILGWTGLARVVRGKFLSLREEDFVHAAKFLGAGEARIIFRHMVPSFSSHLIASLTLSVPGMILAETSLSFLGVGLQPPMISWGVLLAQAQQIMVVAKAPWLLLPGAAVVVSVLAFNFAGDGLRDAADPYA